ncbi:MAG: acetyltransferase [Bryobacterales bacterium]|nr:acetyltransferase [Bryobacterales bacterium]
MASLPLVVYGCGTMAYPILDAIRHSLRERDVLLVDDNQSLWGSEIYGYRIGAPLDALGNGPRRFICTIGDNHTRRRLLQQYKANGHTLFSVIHPTAVISPTASIGPGSYVMPLVVVNAEAHVGEGCFLSSTCVVEHHCHIGDYTLLGPGVRMGGSVSIGSLTMVGLGSCIRPGITIGSEATVGAGAVVVRSISDGARVAGNPAKPLSANHHAA